eukprot:TRINITY_DN1514_c0_g1_i5.p1 TRINITY_DN1514_c0_g1~~TRINITY_DN1514_c0_g1_i5.p1  ORF type:complete len:856 (+),score=290.21 TRINITY_DN1514_c0_g1_i5:40-2607(+)
MAKRVASRELNHDNWDQEEESEEAGTFKQATDDEIKGRVIRKAKRRNLKPADQRTNVFSGFTFTSVAAAGANSKPGGENAFSFLNSSSTTNSSESKENKPAAATPSFGFVFGSSKPPAAADDNMAAKPFGGFVFGKPKTDDDESTKKVEEKDASAKSVENGTSKEKVNGTDTSKPEDTKDDKKEETKKDDGDLMAKFIKKKCDTWSCPVCMVSNPADKAKCLCCEEPRPGGGGPKPAAAPPALNGTAADASKSETKADDAPKAMTDSKWTCDICLVRNGATDFKCIACESPKPGANLQQKAKTESKWTCDICLVKNGPSDSKCIACESPKPGSNSQEKEEPAPVSISFGAQGGFKFVGAATDSNKTTGGFTFGASAATEEPAADGGGFKFGGGADAAATSNAGGFTFGAPNKKDDDSSSGGFKFGASADNESSTKSGGFTFGSTKEESPAKDNKTGGFTFGATAKKDDDSSSGGFKFGASATTSPPVEKPTSIFSNKTPEKSSGEGDKKGGFFFGGGTSSADPKSGTGTFAFGSSSSKTPEQASEGGGGGFKFGTTNNSFQFGAAKSEEKKDAGKTTPGGGLKFGGGSDSSTPSTPSTGFFFGAKSKAEPFGAPQGPFGTPSGEKSSTTATAGGATATPTSTAKLTSGGSRKAEYLGQVKSLNLQVTSWINKHVDSNPLVDLTPVFKDYEKHITNIRNKYGVQMKNVEGSETKTQTNLETDQAVATGSNVEEVAGGSSEHKEENSFFSTKCKLFLKQENKYEERGLGFVHLKKLEGEEEKTQLIVRSDNALGTILLNILVNNSKTDKAGEKDVLLITVPNPPISTNKDEEGRPATFLIRVKKELRDEFYSHLKQD